MKNNFYYESLESMQNISKEAEERGWTHFDIIFLIWKAFRLDDNDRLRHHIGNWIGHNYTRKERESINE
tara:strand:- start:457 stop:663 length:207 start_codon:yes stop_codon:yes gene_type:complete